MKFQSSLKVRREVRQMMRSGRIEIRWDFLEEWLKFKFRMQMIEYYAATFYEVNNEEEGDDGQYEGEVMNVDLIPL